MANSVLAQAGAGSSRRWAVSTVQEVALGETCSIRLMFLRRPFAKSDAVVGWCCGNQRTHTADVFSVYNSISRIMIAAACSADLPSASAMKKLISWLPRTDPLMG